MFSDYALDGDAARVGSFLLVDRKELFFFSTQLSTPILGRAARSIHSYMQPAFFDLSSPSQGFGSDGFLSF